LAWQALLPHIADFWHLVCTRLDARSRAGRLKQWLNFLRRRYPQAETAYQQLKTVNDPAQIDAWLARQTSPASAVSSLAQFDTLTAAAC
jgi:tRNA-dihydrouridine synthase C